MVASGEDPAVTRYIERVRAIPALDRDTEHDLALCAQRGDRAAADALVHASLRYVVAVAIQYRRYAIRLGDLIAEGNLGLVMAVRKFDPERGTRFVTYAGYWIRAYILDCVVRSTSMVGAGSGALRSKVFFRLRRERAKLANLVADQEERTEILAAQFNVSADRMATMLRRLEARDVSLDQPLFQDATTTLVDSLPEPGESQEDGLMRSERQSLLRARLGAALRDLDGRERYIVESRILGSDSRSLAAIGRTLGVSRERARQLEARAKRKLRERLQDLEAAVA